LLITFKNDKYYQGIAWELAIALHIVADDHSHRQGNNGWIAHTDWEHINIADNKEYGYFTYNGEEVALDGRSAGTVLLNRFNDNLVGESEGTKCPKLAAK
jgi:hypothetical protein